VFVGSTLLIRVDLRQVELSSSKLSWVDPG
jgi:hypothetical protein